MPDQEKSPIDKKISVAEIKDSVVVMKDSSLRGVLMTNSLNFALKSTEEQDAITFRYQDFLNSLDFPLQILVVTRKYEVSDYLAMLEKKRVEQENELLKVQINEYIDFIKGLTQLVNIMSTFFYLIVPFTQTAEKQAVGAVDKITEMFKERNRKKEGQTYVEMRTGLLQRMEYISSGLTAIGLKTAPLNNDELLELFYQMYNPDAKEKVKIDSTISAPEKITGANS